MSDQQYWDRRTNISEGKVLVRAGKIMETPATALTVRGHDQHWSADMPESSETDPTSVYLYFDKRDTLIYVGITSRGIARNRKLLLVTDKSPQLDQVHLTSHGVK